MVEVILCSYATEVHTNSSVFLISLCFQVEFERGADEQGLLDRAREVPF